MHARAIPLARFRIGGACALLFTLVGCAHYERQGDVPRALIEAGRRLAQAEKRKANPQGHAVGCLAVAKVAATERAKAGSTTILSYMGGGRGDRREGEQRPRVP